MQDLQEVTQDVHYENYRSERLAKGVTANRKTGAPAGQNATAAPEEKERILQEKEAELRRMQAMLAQMQAQMQQQQPQ